MVTSIIDSTLVPTNWRSQIDQIVRGYEHEPAKGLVHGIQKDAIQNSWGHKTNKRGTGWGMKFKLINNNKGNFLIIEDWGTHGLTGPNINMDEIGNYADLPNEFRLARFSTMNFSGGNEGAGLFGRGKTLFSAASKNAHYFYDSLVHPEGYRANYKKLENTGLILGKEAAEGKGAENLIFSETGLEPLKRVGTRLIISNPIEELVEAIKTGEFKKNIEETWWRIILKYDAEILIEYDDNIEKAVVPKIYSKYIEDNEFNVWNIEHVKVPKYYTLKRLCFYITEEELPEDLQGVYIYRKDMKVGEVPLNIPSRIKKKYFGFIEVDEGWENELANIEDLEHYGFNRRKLAFQNIKNITVDEHEKFMESKGLIKKNRNSNEVLIQELYEVSDELDQLLDNMSLNNTSGNKVEKEAIKIRWDGVSFPDNSVKNKVLMGDTISNIGFKIKNNSGATKAINYKLYIAQSGNEKIILTEGTSNVMGSHENYIGPVDLEINESLERFKKYIILLEVNIKGNKKIIKKEIPFYLDTSPEPIQGSYAHLKITNMDFPDDSSKRVNTNQKISNIRYEIESHYPETMHLGLHLSTHNGEDSQREMIEQIFLKKDIVLKPFEKIEISSPDIIFTKDKYEAEMLRGKIEIRARISATDDFGIFEVGEVITKNPPLIVFLNQDGDSISETFNNKNLIESDERRSKISGSKGNWDFNLYIQHPNYKRLNVDEDERKEYIAEELLKQTLMVHLSEGNYSVLDALNRENGLDKRIEDYTELELIEQVYLAVDNLQLKRYQSEGM